MGKYDPKIPNGATESEKAIARAVYADINRLDRSAPYCPPYVTTNKPDATKDEWRFRCIFFSDTSKPAWSDGAVWRYADGSAA